jgi:hypothetical protein
MKYNPINSTFVEGDKTLIVKESRDEGRTCRGCWYNSWINRKCRAYPYSCCTHGHACTPTNRKDKKQVIFKLLTK